MITDIQSFLDEAYHRIYAQAPKLFPEFDFRPTTQGSGYRSNNHHKIDGTEGEAFGVVYYYAATPFGFKDYTRGFITIYNYLKQRDQLEDYQVLGRIAELSGKPLPNQSLNRADKEEYRKQARQSELLEACNTFFVNCLSHKNNKLAQTTRAEQLRKYLTEDRKFKAIHFRLPETKHVKTSSKMELGFMPGWKALMAHLKQLEYTTQEIQENLKFNRAVGYTHTLAIPYRNIMGEIKGFAFRNIYHKKGDKSPKYLYSVGLKRSSILFGLRRMKANQDLVLVEGLLDAMNANANGLEPVVAIGSASLSIGQVDVILRSKVRSVTLCLDNDNAGKLGVDHAIKKLQEQIGRLEIYVAQLTTVKDLDELITKQGIEAAQNLIQSAIPLAVYWGEKFLSEAKELIAIQSVKKASKLLDQLLPKITDIELKLKDRISINRFRAVILPVLERFQLNPAVLDDNIQRHFHDKQQQRYLGLLLRLHRRIGDAIALGNVAEVERLYTKGFRELKVNAPELGYHQLKKTTSWSDLQQQLKNTPTAIPTGFQWQLGNKEQTWDIPPGTLNALLAPSGHGKTVFLCNLLINVLKNKPDVKIHFFAHKEAKEQLLLKCLNTFLEMDLDENNHQFLVNYFQNPSQYETQSDYELLSRKSKWFFTNYLQNSQLQIHTENYTTRQLLQAVSYLWQTKSADLILIDDYQQLLLNDANQGANFEWQLYKLSQKTKIPIFLSQSVQTNINNVNFFNIKTHETLNSLANQIFTLWNSKLENINLDLSKTTRIKKKHKVSLKCVKDNQGGLLGAQLFLTHFPNRDKLYKIQ
ncbi:MAG: toprim domain-containing protein [Saprospiraceae bacterium]|nr:toprim domain-containing protein [Saprospiraceae bacterium]